MYWHLDWWCQWSVHDYKHLGPAYNCRSISSPTNQYCPLIYLVSPSIQAAVSSTVANDLMAIQDYLMTCPKHVPSNLITVVNWHAIGELYHVSWLLLGL